ncbi:MAG: cytidylyltransferase domain-containing protein [Clostridium sp.]
MINGKKILAIIPARGGSKGVHKKNIKDLCGKPLIGYTIEAAQKSNYIDRIIVSTDDNEILEAVKKFNLEVPFIRPKELAKDDTSSMDVIMHTISWCENNFEYYDYICLLQCTSPFRDSKQIDEAVEMLINQKSDSIVSICESDVSPYWMKNLENGKIVDFVKDKNKYIRRQDLPKVYKLNGAIYICEMEKLKDNKSWYTKNTLGYVMNSITSLDIDTFLDFKLAEVIIKEKEYEL